MEEKQKSIAANALQFGLFAGGAMIVYFLVLYIFNQHLNRNLSSLGFIFLIAAMAYGTFQYRQQYMNNFMSYGKAVTSCFLIGVFAIALSSVFNFIFYNYIDPGVVQQMLDMAREKMLEKAPNMSDQQMETALSMQAKFMSPVALTFFGLFFGAIISLLVSLLVAIFLKKEDKSIMPLV